MKFTSIQNRITKAFYGHSEAGQASKGNRSLDVAIASAFCRFSPHDLMISVVGTYKTDYTCHNAVHILDAFRNATETDANSGPSIRHQDLKVFQKENNYKMIINLKIVLL